MPTICFASRNPKKAIEMADLMQPHGIAVRGVSEFEGAPEVDETGNTFAANAELKASIVAKAVGILLAAEGIAGECYNCYDMYIADQDVASIAQEVTGSASVIEYLNEGPKNQISTKKLRELGMHFSGDAAVESTVRALLKG